MTIKGYKTKVRPSPQVHELKRLIDKWREPELLMVRSNLIVPDTSNRSHTGLSVDHCHLIASMMLKDGFRSREAQYRRNNQQGHDIPVLVRGCRSSPISVESLAYWRSATHDEPDFPRVTIADGWFTSLGNGHFMQALNLFEQQCVSVFTEEAFTADPSDQALTKALHQGVQSIVLRSETPVQDRCQIALLLNKTHDYKWSVDASGAMDVRPEACENARHTLFEAQSKHLDSGWLTLQVRLELGLKTSDRSPIPDGDDGTPWPKSKQLAPLIAKKQSKL